MKKIVFLLLSCGLLALVGTTSMFKHAADDTAPRRGEILFLGNTSKHHDSGKYAPWLAIELFKAGINLTYTTDTDDLNTANLAKYDGLVIYANYDKISKAKEQALKSFVEGGKGLIPLHAASACFTNSAWYIGAVGGQYKSEKGGVFKTTIINKTHPVMQGISEFSSWDEAYVHSNLNADKTVLMTRVENGTSEPWTWVRNQGKGRVFYTASGHNDSTWTNLNFLRLVRNGVMWSIGDKVKDQIAKLNIPNIDIYPDTISHFDVRHIVPKMQTALSPPQAMKTIQVSPDFEVKLFASEPDITNPIAMSWDEKGRLWIVESVDYPNTFLETDGAANDRIKICEDTNGDGKADKFTIFADKLNIPTSIAFANGGVVVTMAPYFVFLKDTNGDDKADVRENIMTGWEKNDTHFGPSNLQYGFDNKLWGVVGSGFNGTTIDGKSMNFSRGVYNVDPDGKNATFLANTSNNTWGLGFSEDNNVFISTANALHSAFYSMPAWLMQRQLTPRITPVNASTGAQAGQVGQQTVQPVQSIQGHSDAHTMTPNIRQVDVFGGFTAAAGHHMYTARNFPKKYWNRIAFVNEPTMRLVHESVIEPNGAGFTEKDGWNIMDSNDEWFGPVQAEVGPDGAVWVSDWYNFIIQHNVFVERQAPSELVLPFKDQPRGQGNAFSSPMRDLDYGRIYRIVYKNGKPYTPVKLDRNNVSTLISGLNNDNMFWRMTAQRLLVESKNLAALPEIYKIINDQKVDEIGLNSPAVHALWTVHGLGALSGSNAEAVQVATKALSHPAAGVRKAAMQVLPKTTQTADAILKAGLTNDKDLNIRMNAFVTLASLPPSSAIAKAALTASNIAENAKDEYISKAIFAVATLNDEAFKAIAPQAFTMGSVGQEISLTQRIVEGLAKEVYSYPVGNRVTTTAFAPDVTGKEITIRVAFTKRGSQGQGQQGPGPGNAPANSDGFIVGQGDKNNGYGLYILDGKLNMVVKQNGQAYTATTTAPLQDKFNLVARLAANGEMTVMVDDKEVANAKAPSAFTKPLGLTLRTGSDNVASADDKIGTYPSTFLYAGMNSQVSLELKK